MQNAGSMPLSQRSIGEAGLFATVENWLATGIEFIAAALLALEVVLLFCGVMFRYIFHQPLVWGEELSEIFFIWMIAFGAVVALRRAEHMRLTMVTALLSPAWQAWCEALSLLSILIFTFAILMPSLDYANDQIIVLQPVLGISDAWRVSAIAAGLILMALFSVLRLVNTVGIRALGLALLFIACIAGGLWLAQASTPV